MHSKQVGADTSGHDASTHHTGVGGPKSPNCHQEWRVKQWPPATLTEGLGLSARA
jgi:hypothetical protein